MPLRKLSRQPFVGTHVVSRIAICACGLFLAFTLYAQDVSTPGTPSQGPGTGRGAPAANLNKFIVTFSPTTTVEERVAAATAVGATIGHNLYRWNQLAITVPNLNAIGALANNLSVLSIVPDRPLSAGIKGGNGGGGVNRPRMVAAEAEEAQHTVGLSNWLRPRCKEWAPLQPPPTALASA